MSASTVATRTASRLRRGTPADSRAASGVLMEAARDLTARQGIDWNPDPDEFWAQSEALFQHLATGGLDPELVERAMEFARIPIDAERAGGEKLVLAIATRQEPHAQHPGPPGGE